MKKLRIGVMGAYRGTSMINYCKASDNAEIVAICDNWPTALEKQRENNEGMDIAYYDNFDEFIEHDMDAVVLANYANEHAPFAIKALKKGKHVFSEVLPCQTMKEAVELVETVEETGLIYAYGENYCYMPATYEMYKLYREDKIGEFEYGECEYVHNCEPIWPDITYGDPDHWRNNWFSTFYCTHSLGPIIHTTGLRPVSVVGFEGTMTKRNLRTGCKGGQFGIEMVTLENGAIVKSIHGGLYNNSIWYCMYGSKGRLESSREDEGRGGVSQILVNVDEYDGEYSPIRVNRYHPEKDMDDKFGTSGHSGGDFYCIYHFVEKALGNENADIIDVYEAMDMYLPGIFAYRSILQGGVTVEVPNLRDKAERDKWRNDTACTDPKVAGDMLLPTSVNGTPEIDQGIYDHMFELYENRLKDENSTINRSFKQSETKKK